LAHQAARSNQAASGGKTRKSTVVLVGDLKFITMHFPFDSNEKIEMYAFGFEPGFQILAGIRAELDEHFSFEHVDEDTLRACESAGLHALGKSFGSLARKASKRVLGEVAWHWNSREQFETPSIS